MNSCLKIGLIVWLLPVCAFADLNDSMSNFMGRFNSSSNVTGASVYDGQKAGYMSGGGLAIRNQIVSRQPVSVTLPSVDAGCGGIDLYTGAFSYINSDELVKTFKSIASSAAGYAFLLGLESVSPQMANNLKNLQAMANEINSQNINSCEIGSQLVGMAWPRETAAREGICRRAQAQNGMSGDWVRNRHRCSDMGRNASLASDKTNSPEFAALIYDEHNVVWDALNSHNHFSGDNKLAEAFMTMMGTVIRSIDKDGNYKTEYLPAKVFEEEFLDAIIKGGSTTVYECTDKERCLVVKQKEYTISEADSWLGYVRNKLINIENKIAADEELEQEEVKFLGKTRFPLYRIMNVMSAFSKGNNPVDVYRLAEDVATDMFLQYLRETIDLTRQACMLLKAKKWFSDDHGDYLKHLNAIEAKIAYYELRTSNRLEKELQLDQKIRFLEEELSQRLNVLH